MAGEFKRGDRVRVTTEVELLDELLLKLPAYGGAQLYGYRAKFNGLEVIVPESAHIEKIEPPVVNFRPGDLLRKKGRTGPPLWALGREGFTYLPDGNYYEYGQFYRSMAQDALALEGFTSAEYEKVAFDE